MDAGAPEGSSNVLFWPALSTCFGRLGIIVDTGNAIPWRGSYPQKTHGWQAERRSFKNE
jgi:hypothetical protein